LFASFGAALVHWLSRVFELRLWLVAGEGWDGKATVHKYLIQYQQP